MLICKAQLDRFDLSNKMLDCIALNMMWGSCYTINIKMTAPK